MKCQLVLLAVIILTSQKITAQNLIYNNHFEQNDSCPYTFGQLNFCKNWYCPTKTSSDYYYKCTDSSIWPPILGSHGFQYPRSQWGMIGICTIERNNWGYQYREYAQTKLNAKLKPNYRYGLTLYVNACSFYCCALTLGSNNTGALFTTWPVKNDSAFFTPPNHFPSLIYIPQKPQVNFTQLITDTLGWTKLSREFVADSAYEYMTLGNFYRDSETQTVPIDDTTWQAPTNAYQLFDDLELIELGPNGVEELGIENDELSISPNPVKDELRIRSLWEGQVKNLSFLQGMDDGPSTALRMTRIDRVEVFDVLGRKQITKPLYPSANHHVINVSNLASGIYFIKAMDRNGQSLTSKFVKE
jgi:hypothetical protein